MTRSTRPRPGRPRRPETDASILRAAREVLAAEGFSGLSMSDVAARAQVAKTTLYRRWPSKSELALDALAVLFDDLELPDRGSLALDAAALLRQLAELLGRPETQSALLAVVSESARNSGLRLRLRQLIVDPQKRLVHEGRQRAQLRGELAEDAGPGTADAQMDLILDTVAGAVLHRTVVTGEPVDDAWISGFVALLIGGLAGADPSAAQLAEGSDLCRAQNRCL